MQLDGIEVSIPIDVPGINLAIIIRGKKAVIKCLDDNTETDSTDIFSEIAHHIRNGDLSHTGVKNIKEATEQAINSYGFQNLFRG